MAKEAHSGVHTVSHTSIFHKDVQLTYSQKPSEYERHQNTACWGQVGPSVHLPVSFLIVVELNGSVPLPSLSVLVPAHPFKKIKTRHLHLEACYLRTYYRFVRLSSSPDSGTVVLSASRYFNYKCNCSSFIVSLRGTSQKVP